MLGLPVALALDAWLGEPDSAWKRVPHPVVLIGNAVDAMDRIVNKGKGRRIKGVAVAALLIFGAAVIGAVISMFGWFVEAIAAAILLSHKSLIEHVRAVADGLRRSEAEGRREVAKIVGRDTASLDSPAIARAAIESAAENFSDGVVAPAFWFALFGLPGMLAYKAINTADSMIGYKNHRYAEFGWAVARLDDGLNWVPARLSAVVFCFCGRAQASWLSIRADARLHRSLNAGWPEAAMAQTLNVALSGPRAYEAEIEDAPYIHANGKRQIGPAEIDEALTVLWQAWRWVFSMALAFALLTILF